MDKPRRTLGIDPGINGACALYCPDEIVPTPLGGLFDIPTVGEGKQREIDYAELRNLIYALQPTVAVIEIVNAFMPARGQGMQATDDEGEKVAWGNTSLFRFGGSYYAIHAVVACLDIPRHRVTSPAWKGHFGLRGKKKSGGIDDSARQVVLQRWPALKPFLKRKGDQHRAEAFLMAAWYAQTDGGLIKPPRSPRRPKAAESIRAMRFSGDDGLDIPE